MEKQSSLPLWMQYVRQWVSRSVADWHGWVQNIQFLMTIAILLLTRGAYELTDASKVQVNAFGGYKWPIIILGCLVLARLIVVPYWMWKEKHERALKLEAAMEPVRILNGMAHFVNSVKDLKKKMGGDAALGQVSFSVPQIVVEANKWADEVKQYLLLELGGYWVTKLENEYPISHYPRRSREIEDADAVRSFVWGRAEGLNKITAELEARIKPL